MISDLTVCVNYLLTLHLGICSLFNLWTRCTVDEDKPELAACRASLKFDRAYEMYLLKLHQNYTCKGILQLEIKQKA